MAHSSRKNRPGRSTEQGMALFFVILAIVAIMGAITVVAGTVTHSKRMTDFSLNQALADEASKAGIELAISQLWNDYLVSNGGAPGNLTGYQTYLNGLVPNNEDLNENGIRDNGETDSNVNGIFEANAPLALVSENDPTDLAAGPQLTSVTIMRTDDTSGSTFEIRSQSRYATQTSMSTQSIRVSGALFTGFEYMVLANNINCILCHAEIRPLDLARNTDPAMYNSFNRIKVGMLESLMVRTGTDAFAAHSTVAGTTYSRGQVYDQDHDPLSASNLANSTFKAYKTNNTNGKIIQNSSGTMTKVNLANATTNPQGALNQYASLYLNYPTTTGGMTDGQLPTSFPAPYNDGNNNRRVDTAEFDSVMATADGAITGGIVYGVASTSTYTGSGLPTSSNAALGDLSDGTYDGNLILNGTASNPIVLDGKITVKGDVVINGKVKGWGQILTKGNIYIVGDTTYADAPGEFGVAADGTRNGLALIAGGNILMGDYLTRTALDKSGTSSILSEYQIETRTANKVVATGKDVGYKGAKAIDPGFNTSGEPITSFTSSELMMFNRMEYQKKLADSSYVPRYYRIRPTQPVYQYTADGQHSSYYNVSGVSAISTTSATTVLDLSPANYWISEAKLRDIWWTDEQSRPSSGRPFQFDGLLYSNNAIFGLVRSNVRHKSNTMGQMTIRGSIVSPDLGILAPGRDDTTSRTALQFFYDRRVNDFFRIEDTSRVTLTRRVFLNH